MRYPGLLPWNMKDLTRREWIAICDDHAARVRAAESEV